MKKNFLKFKDQKKLTKFRDFYPAVNNHIFLSIF